MTEPHANAGDDTSRQATPPDEARGDSRNMAAGKLILLCCLGVCLLAGSTLVVGGLHFYGEAKKHELEMIRTMTDASRVSELPDDAFPFLHGEKPVILETEQFPKHLRDALVAREDSRFWNHHGVDLRGVARAALRNLEERQIREGAGTITMQLARTAYGFQARTLRRKIIEAMVALRIERNFDKEEILTAYMNWVFLGMDNHGFEQASREYFGKPAGALTLSEGAALVGMLRAPNRLDPVRHPEAAIRERDAVLLRMVDEGMLTREEAQAAMRQPLPGKDPR